MCRRLGASQHNAVNSDSADGFRTIVNWLCRVAALPCHADFRLGSAEGRSRVRCPRVAPLRAHWAAKEHFLAPTPAERRAQEPNAQTDRYFHHSHHRRRPDHHRPGVRIRLFGHAGLQDIARRGLSHRAHQFQSGHDHDRSGHGGPDLYRADHAGNRREDHRQGALCDPGRLRAIADHGRPDRAQLRALLTQDGRARAL